MAVPSNWTRVTVQGRFLNLDGTPMTGQVTFTPTARVLLDATAGTVIAGTSWSVTLDGTGFFTVQLPATDDPDINPTGLTEVDDVASFAYSVAEPTGRRYTLVVPSAAGTIDLVAIGAAGSITPPGAPTIGTATAGNGQATVSFTPPISTGGASITSYTVTSSPGGITASGSSSPITVTGLGNGTTYTFTVRATNAAGSGAASAASNPATPTGSGPSVPGAPTIGTATAGSAGSGQVSVTFTPPASDGGAAITSYTATSTPGGITGTGSASPITVSGLTPGATYTFKVKATNSAGTGSDSAASNSVTPPASGGGGPAPVLQEALQVSAVNALELTTDPFTPADGDVLIIKTGTWASTIAPGTPSGGGLTWTQRIVENGGTFNGRMEIWTAVVGASPGPMTITLSAPASSCFHAMLVERWSGGTLAATPVTASGFTNAPPVPASIGLTTTADNSVISWGLFDAISAAPTTRSYLSSAVEDGLVDRSTQVDGVFYFAYQVAATAGAQTFGLASPNTRYNAAGIEIKPSGAAPPAPLGRIAPAQHVITLREHPGRRAAIPPVISVAPVSV